MTGVIDLLGSTRRPHRSAMPCSDHSGLEWAAGTVANPTVHPVRGSGMSCYCDGCCTYNSVSQCIRPVSRSPRPEARSSTLSCANNSKRSAHNTAVGVFRTIPARSNPSMATRIRGCTSHRPSTRPRRTDHRQWRQARSSQHRGCNRSDDGNIRPTNRRATPRPKPTRLETSWPPVQQIASHLRSRNAAILANIGREAGTTLTVLTPLTPIGARLGCAAQRCHASHVSNNRLTNGVSRVRLY